MKINLLFIFLVILFSCNKKEVQHKESSHNVSKRNDLRDSIRKAQEQEVINMDDSYNAEKSLKEDLKKFK